MTAEVVNRWEIVAKTTSLVYILQLVLALYIPIILRAPDYGIGATEALTIINAAAIFPAIYLFPRAALYLWPYYVLVSAIATALFSVHTPYTLDATLASPAFALYPLLLMAPGIAFAYASWIKPKAVIGLYATYWLGFIGVPLLALTYAKFLG